MKNRRRMFLSLILLFAFPVFANDESRPGYYSSSARLERAISPDKSKTAAVRLANDDDDNGNRAEISVDWGKLHFRTFISFGLNAEILWSDDSRAFAVTGSNGGAVGTYATEVFFVSRSGLQRKKIGGIIEHAFGHPVRCGWPETPNIVAITWADKESSRLIVAAQILPHSNCDSMGTFRAYELDLKTLRVVRSFDQLRAKEMFAASLGPELRNAQDECITTPRSCYVPTNHPSK